MSGNRRRSRLAALAATGGVAAGLFAALGANPATAAEATAATDFGACLAAQDGGDLLLLMDQSGSLSGPSNGNPASDPDDQRVTAAQVLLSRLADSAAAAGATVNVAVAGFDATYDDVADWTELTATSLSGLQSTVADFADRDNGFETDYWTALTEAREALAERRGGETGSCQALLWFTDGAFDLGVRSGGEVERYGRTKAIPGVEDVPLDSDTNVRDVETAGKNDLCRDGGGADALRADGVYLLAVGLNASGNIDLDFLRRVAEDSDGDCGAQPPRGQVFESGDLTGLVIAFDTLGDPFNVPQPQTERPVCQSADCATPHTFELDASIRSFHLIGGAPVDSLVTRVTAPGAEPVDIGNAPATTSGTVNAGAVALDYTWVVPGIVQIDAEYPADGANWSGTWTVAFYDPTGQSGDAISRAQFTVVGDLFVGIPDGEVATLRVGDPTDIPIELQRTDGQPTLLGTPAPTLTLDAVLRSLVDPSAEVELVQNADTAALNNLKTTGIAERIPPDFPAGPAVIEFALGIRSSSGIDLGVGRRDERVTVEAPPNYPVVSADEVHFGRIEGTTPATAEIAVTGPGCVWLDPRGGSLQSYPSAVTAPVLTSPHDSPDTCLELADDEQGVLPVSLAPDVQDEGELAGKLTVQTAPAGDLDRAAPAVVTFDADLVRRAVVGVLLWAFVVAMVVGLGLPLLLFGLSRRLAARFPQAPLQSVLVPATVGPNGLGAVDLPPQWDLVLPPEGGRRRVSPSGVSLLARAGWKLTRAGYAQAADENAVGVAGGAEPYDPKSLRARTTLALHNTWMLLVDRSAAAGSTPEVPVRLLLVVGAEADNQQRRDLLDRARTEVGSLLAGLRETLRTASAEDRDKDAGGTAASPGDAAAADAGWGPGPAAGSGAPSGWGSSPAAPGPSTPSGWGSSTVAPGASTPSGWGPGPAAGAVASSGWGSASGPPQPGWGSGPGASTAGSGTGPGSGSGSAGWGAAAGAAGADRGTGTPGGDWGSSPAPGRSQNAGGWGRGTNADADAGQGGGCGSPAAPAESGWGSRPGTTNADAGQGGGWASPAAPAEPGWGSRPGTTDDGSAPGWASSPAASPPGWGSEGAAPPAPWGQAGPAADDEDATRTRPHPTTVRRWGQRPTEPPPEPPPGGAG